MQAEQDIILQKKYRFMQGGGEMGALTRAHNWAGTGLGEPDNWPLTLRIMIATVLSSKFPMLLFWGSEMIQFYNDAFRPSFGHNSKHPLALGQRAEDCWAEIWDNVGPVLNGVFNTGEAVWSEDQLIPIYRNGQMENVYWTYSYSAVRNENGDVEGILVVVTETTDKILGLQQLGKSHDDLQFAIEASELGSWDLHPVTMKFKANDRVKEWFGVPPQEEVPLQLALDVIAEKDRQKVVDAIQLAMQYESGGKYEVEYTIIHPETGAERIVKAKGRALFNSDNMPYRFNGTLQDITEAVSNLKKSEKNENKVRSIVAGAPFPIGVYTGREMRIEVANQTILDIWGKGNDVIGKLYTEILPELENQEIFQQLDSVYTTGVPFHAKNQRVDLMIDGEMKSFYFSYSFTPLYDADGEIYGVMNTAADVTELNLAKQKVEKGQQDLRNIILQAPAAMCILRGPEYIVEIANEDMLELWGKTTEQVMNKPLLDGLHEVRDQGIEELLNNVYTTGETFRAYEWRIDLPRSNKKETVYVNFTYEPFFEGDGSISGIIVVALDVTDQVLSRKTTEEAEERLRLAVDATSLSHWELDPNERSIIHSPRLAEIFGHDAGVILTHPQMREQIHPEDRKAVVEKAFDTAMLTGVYSYEARVVKPDTTVGWIRTRGKVFFDDNKKPLKLIGTLQDITAEKQYQQQLEEREQKFRLLADSMPQFVWTGDADGNLNYFNRTVYSYSGLSEEQIAEHGWLQIVHPDDREENIVKWMQAITTGETFLFEHRFRRHDGEYRWQLSRAIPQHDSNGEIRMWVGTSTDIQYQKSFSAELENQVKERTQELEQKNIELEKTNSELAQFAYIASHDLQEPLRKVSTFAQMLETSLGDIDARSKTYLEKINNSTARMISLIRDVLSYSQLSKGDVVIRPADLNEILQGIENDFELLIEQKRATIEYDKLPAVEGIPLQLSQLFTNLISNSLKFSKAGVDPVINIKTTMLSKEAIDSHPSLDDDKEYYNIEFRDNGIGFSQEHAAKIFNIFQRLHNRTEYSGTGIGLAMCKKIVQNHKGEIYARAVKGEGAVFNVILPKEQ